MDPTADVSWRLSTATFRDSRESIAHYTDDVEFLLDNQMDGGSAAAWREREFEIEVPFGGSFDIPDQGWIAVRVELLAVLLVIGDPPGCLSRYEVLPVCFHVGGESSEAAGRALMVNSPWVVRTRVLREAREAEIFEVVESSLPSSAGLVHLDDANVSDLFMLEFRSEAACERGLLESAGADLTVLCTSNAPTFSDSDALPLPDGFT